MINSISLKNFQSHKDTHIEFHSGVNAIVGLSDSGKTAILRALNWVINNRPSGDAFQSHWGGDTEVTVELWNGDTITRGRTKSDNYYVLNGEEYRAFGQDVPEPIKKAFNMNEVNLQSQMDAPFLLSCGPGEVAQILNKVADLDIIDASISNVRKKKMETDRALSEVRARSESLHDQFEAFSFIDGMEKSVEKLEELVWNVEQKGTVLQSLQYLIADNSKAKAKAKAALAVLAAEKPLQAVFSARDKQALAQQKLGSLQTIIQQIKEKHALVSQAEKLQQAHQQLNEVEGLVGLLRDKEEDANLLNIAITSIRGKKNATTVLKNVLDKLERQFHEAMPEQCPLCGQEVK